MLGFAQSKYDPYGGSWQPVRFGWWEWIIIVLIAAAYVAAILHFALWIKGCYDSPKNSVHRAVFWQQPHVG